MQYTKLDLVVILCRGYLLEGEDPLSNPRCCSGFNACLRMFCPGKWPGACSHRYYSVFLAAQTQQFCWPGHKLSIFGTFCKLELRRPVWPEVKEHRSIFRAYFALSTSNCLSVFLYRVWFSIFSSSYTRSILWLNALISPFNSVLSSLISFLSSVFNSAKSFFSWFLNSTKSFLAHYLTR